MIGSKKSLRENYPHADADWLEDLVVALRLREVSGARIGEVLEEVETHCAATGESAHEAFGTPKAYAESLDYPGQARAPRLVGRRDLVLGGLSLLGAGMVSGASTAFAAGESVHLRFGHVLQTLLVMGMLLLVVRCLEWIVGHLFLAWVAGCAFIAAGVGLLVWGGPELVRLPSLAMLVLGFALMIGVAIVQTREGGEVATDAIVRPGQALDERERAGSRRTMLAVTWMLPVFMAVMTLATWFLTR